MIPSPSGVDARLATPRRDGRREARRRLLRAVEHEARGEEQGLGVLVELAAFLPGPNAEGRYVEFFAHKKTRSFRFSTTEKLLSGPGFGTL